MKLSDQTLVRVSDMLILVGASALFLTAFVNRFVGEAAARPVFVMLCAAMLGGLWLRVRLWESEGKGGTRSDRRI